MISRLNKIIKNQISKKDMQKLCSQDPTGKGIHCFCVGIDVQRGIKKCCKCNQWNIQGNDWTDDEDFR